MRVAFVVHTFPVISETFIVNQIISLIDSGHDIEILAFQKGDFSKIHNSIIAYNLIEKVTYLKSEPKNKISRLFNVFKNGILKPKNVPAAEFVTLAQSVFLLIVQIFLIALFFLPKSSWYLLHRQ